MAWFQKKPTETAAESPKTTPPVRVGKGLKVASILAEDTILFPGEGHDKAAVLQTLAAAVCGKAGIADWASFLAKVQEREQGISTTLDTGLSLPHARMDGIPGILAGMAVLKKPIPDPKQPDLAIRVMFLFFSPNKQDAFPLHLQLLRGVSSLFQPALIDQLTASSGPAAALELIKKLEA
ncbi:MAG: PTS sugar transporter subunit IIA [Elusimicrobia bacterium]|nr:PTS sugar transporter subunit IIA [Elusimicrobiota bacterium]